MAAAAKKPKPTPAEAAAKGVDQLFFDIAQGPEALFSDSIFAVNLAPVFEATKAAVIREEEALQGRILTDEDHDNAAMAEMLGWRVGYVVGVEVGRRLRGR